MKIQILVDGVEEYSKHTYTFAEILQLQKELKKFLRSKFSKEEYKIQHRELDILFLDFTIHKGVFDKDKKDEDNSNRGHSRQEGLETNQPG